MTSAAWTFWLAAAAMVAVALAFVLPRLLGRGVKTPGAQREALNAQIYRADLDDLDRDRDAGTLAPDDYARARLELERRLLEDAQAEAAAAPARRVRGVGAAVGIALPVAAFGLYLAFGTPAAIDAPAAEATGSSLSGADFRAQLVAHLKDAPRDGRAWVALARLDMNEDRFDDAAKHFAQATEVSPKIARDPDILCEHADALGMAQGGQLAGRPAELVARALALAPDNARALEMAGSAAYEQRDFRAAAQHWRALLEQIPAGTPAHVELATAIERADRLGAITLPPATAGTAPGGG